MGLTLGADLGIAGPHFGHHCPNQRHGFECIEGQQARAQGVVDVVGVVGNVVSDGRRLGFERGEGGQAQIGAGRQIIEASGQALKRIFAKGGAIGIDEGAVVLEDALKGFPGEIEPVMLSIAVFEASDDAQGLDVVVEPTPRSARSSSSPRARAMERAIWLTSSVWVSRLRKWRPS
ncbi:MAG: hypothetical protein K0R85_2705 [Devosia sp.]|nr:hypothetical protein [Devosia sp.]